MSKKTENIYGAISSLEQLQVKLETYNKTLAEPSREREDIAFEQLQQIRNLKLWIDSLYRYNGKSTSNAKKKASQENGKKGGRPPKEITQLRRRSGEIDNEIISLEHDKIMAIDSESVRQIEQSIDCLAKEKEEILIKLSEWEQSKNIL